MNTSNNEESTSELKRTWGAYPDIQKDFPYSDQCIEELIAKYVSMVSETKTKTI